MSKGENIVKWIKGQRISWLGHLERMEEDRMPKKIFAQEMEGTRRGRPRKGWKEGVERDQVLGVRRWRELVADRKKRTLFDRPKPTVGCSANGRRSYYITLHFTICIISPFIFRCYVGLSCVLHLVSRNKKINSTVRWVTSKRGGSRY
jgi:hypothetical protein